VYYPQDVQSNLPGQTSGIWSMKVDGTGHCEMMPEDPDQDGRRVRGGDVSEDGSLIAFTYDHRPGADLNQHVALGTVGINGDGCPVVVATAELTEVAGSPLQGSDAWSAAINPSGTMVAVSAGQVTDAGLWIIPIADPTSAWRVPVGYVDSWIPTGASWLDAQTIVYQKYNGRKWEIFKADIYVAWAIISGYIILLGGIFLARFLSGKWKSMRVIERAPHELPPTYPEAPATEYEL